MLGQERVVQAAKHQFRPLLMIALLPVLGMLPLMLVNGTAIVLHHTIITMILGMVFSLLVNLFIVPLLYFILIRQEQTPDVPRL